MKQIPLSKGKFALVDDEDFEYLNQWKWYLSGSESSHYAARDVYIAYLKDKKRSLQQKIYLHKFILDVPRGKEVDHINGSTLDNTRSNLRITDHQHNGYNLKIYKNNKTGHKGVFFYKPTGRWMAYIRVNRKLKHLGYFLTIDEAIKAYNQASIKYHGKYSRINEFSEKGVTYAS